MPYPKAERSPERLSDEGAACDSDERSARNNSGQGGGGGTTSGGHACLVCGDHATGKHYVRRMRIVVECEQKFVHILGRNRLQRLQVGFEGDKQRDLQLCSRFLGAFFGAQFDAPTRINADLRARAKSASTIAPFAAPVASRAAHDSA